MSVKSAKSVVYFIFSLVAMFFTICPVTLKIMHFELCLNYATVPPLLVLLMCLSSIIPFSVVIRGLLGPASPKQYIDASNSNLIPLTVVLLFISLAYVCVSADFSGLFKLIATKFKNAALRSIFKQLVGMLLFYAFAGVFTLCTSNDIVILCLTPIIIEFVNQLNDQSVLIPLLICQFSSANTFSISLLTGNPSNFILTSVFKIDFIQYLKPMVFVGVSAGIVVLIFSLIYLRLFKQQSKYKQFGDLVQPKIGVTLLNGSEIIPNEPEKVETVKMDKFNAVFSTVCLILMFVAFILSPFITKVAPKFDLSYIAVVFAAVQLSKDVYLHKKKRVNVFEVIKALPWGVPLFLIGMFIIVENAINLGVIHWIAQGLANAFEGQSAFVVSLAVSAITVLACILFNNLPGTIVVSRIINDSALLNLKYLKVAALSAAAASNYGALMGPHCSLAGLMWTKMTGKEHQFKTWASQAIIGITCIVVCSGVVTLVRNL
ncbi:Arsenical_pump membrane protein [Hexamita inflata]|uniref:Arsenical pump membrane protein n=1 Tax=Hexamita inflata TaxID=28002 RepID=A0AA86UPS2_9EUKA|nr:Arsenical pump membrane protein [Hexamita inflata]